MSRHRLVRAVVGAALAVLLLPAVALAHPLGNFTVNHYAGLRVEPDRILLDVVIDQAEIPTFQEKLRIDTDGDGMVSDAEAEAERTSACPVLAGSLSLAVDGALLPLVPVEAGLEFPPGAAGLETMRLVCVYLATPARHLAAGTTVAFSDASHAGRIGWREITVVGSGVEVTGGDLPATSVSGRLRAYPQDLIARPLDVRSAAFSVTPGGPLLAPPTIPDARPLPGAPALDGTAPGPSAASPTGTLPGANPVANAAAGPTIAAATSVGSVPGGVGAEVSGLLEARDLTPVVLLGSLVAAMALGAGHAMTPGHGKTLMGAYLVGTRGTALHAIALGLSVTISHTLGILVLAAIVIELRGVISPELFNRYAPVASGLLVLAIGGWLLVGQLRARRQLAASTPDHGHPHEHDHPDEHAHAPGHAHAHGGDDEPGVHSHGGIRHRHTPSADGAVGWRGLFVLGLAGGIIPSTNALIILLATIATGRAVYGLVLVVAFGLGMAVVLGGVGLALVLTRGRLESLPARSSLGRLAGYAPLMAGALVFGLGIWLTGQAVGAAPTL